MAVVDVDDTPGNDVLDEIGPIIVVFPAPVKDITGPASAVKLPEIDVVCIVVDTNAGPIILPVMVIIELAPGRLIIPVVPVLIKVPSILIVTVLPLHTT